MKTGAYETHPSINIKDNPFSLTVRKRERQGTVFVNWHKSLELLCCLSGKGSVIIDGKKQDFLPGDIICINKNQLHCVIKDSDESLSYILLLVMDEFCEMAGINTSEYVLQQYIKSEELCRLFHNAEKEFNTQYDFPLIRRKMAVLAILSELFEKHSEKTDPAEKKRDEMAEVIEYIYRRHKEQITLSDVAALAGLSIGYFTKKFKQITGTTFIMFLNRVRCNSAAELIASGASVQEACFACGFSDPAFFSRVFKNIMGTSPISYKKKG